MLQPSFDDSLDNKLVVFVHRGVEFTPGHMTYIIRFNVHGYVLYILYSQL